MKDIITAQMRESILHQSKSKTKNNMEHTKRASNEFWNEMDRISQEFVDSADSEEKMKNMKNKIFYTSRNIYDCECTKVTARQIMAWQKYRPFQNKEEKV